MVVRVDALARERGDDLVGVHVRGRARAGLEDVDRELIVVLAGGDRVAGRRDAPGEVGSSRPRSAFTRAAAALMRPSQRTTPTGIGLPETGKLSIALRVSAPHSSVMATS